MSLQRHAIIALATVALLGLGRVAADDTVLLKGASTYQDAINLKGSTGEDAETIQVFHGRLLACLCHKGYYSGCYGGGGGCYGGSGGCFGGYGAGYGGYSSGYGGNGGGYGYGGGYSMGATGYQGQVYAAPAPAYYAPSYARAYPIVPSAAYYPAPSAANYAPGPARAIVTLPRLGLTFTIGNGNGTLANRSTLGNLMTPRAEESQAVPPVDSQPEQFRYDGGPAAPIPMPKNIQSLPSVVPNAAAAPNNRVTAAPKGLTWYAYGERPKNSPPPSTLLVKEGHR